MATRIEAIIFEGGPHASALPPGMPRLPLEAGLTMVPVTDDVLSQLDMDSDGDEQIPPGWMLQRPVAALARTLSTDRRVLYMVSETFGGPGAAEAIAWHRSRLLYGPSGTCDLEADLEPGYHLATADNAVNVGLRAIGVVAADGSDEFDTVGLGRHRMTEDWLTG